MKQRLNLQARQPHYSDLPANLCRQASGAAPRPRISAYSGSGARLLSSLTIAVAGLLFSPASHATGPAPASATVLLEQLTTSELRERIAAGATTILIPVGGTEQSGPYLALGKHNVRAQWLAQQIAQKLGNTIVAPVIAYVPEGAISPATGHMRFSGTISIPDATFEALLEASARSLHQHGFRDIILLGDHGGYQKNLSKVAQKLNQSWSGTGDGRAYALLDYYQASQTTYVDQLKQRGHSEAEIGQHAGLADTSLMLAIDRTLVRTDAMGRQPKPGPADGVQGDPRRASAELGQLGVQDMIDASVTRIRNYLSERAARAATPTSHRN